VTAKLCYSIAKLTPKRCDGIANYKFIIQSQTQAFLRPNHFNCAGPDAIRAYFCTEKYSSSPERQFVVVRYTDVE
jgi:hypothetical protein